MTRETATPRPPLGSGTSPELSLPIWALFPSSPVRGSDPPPGEGRLGGSPALSRGQAVEGRALASTQCRRSGSGGANYTQLAAVAWRWPGVSQLAGSPGLLCGKRCRGVWGQRAGRCGQQPEPGLERAPGGAARPVAGSS